MKTYKIDIKYSDERHDASYEREFNINILENPDIRVNEFEISLISKNRRINIEGVTYKVKDLIFKTFGGNKSILLIVVHINDRQYQDDFELDLPF